MTHSKEYQEQILSADLWYKDKNQTADDNSPSFKKRKTGINRGGTREFCIPLHNDIVTAKRYIGIIKVVIGIFRYILLKGSTSWLQT